MAERLAYGTPTTRSWVRVPRKPVGLIKKKSPAWAVGDDKGASVHSAVNEYLAIDRDGNCT